jgi:hypothetical protein
MRWKLSMSETYPFYTTFEGLDILRHETAG